jgi:cytochrome c-type biogenesis protein CcmH
MQRWKNSLLTVILAAVALGQSSSTLLTPEVRRIGGRLACLCGTCNNTVGDCPMLECHYSRPAREKIATMQASGKSDDEIVNSVVKEQGLQALASPPGEGFNLLAWVMPWVAVSCGLIGVWLFIRRIAPKRTAAGAPEINADALKRYQENIEKDLAKQD